MPSGTTGSSDDAYGVDARVGVAEALTLEGYLAGTDPPGIDGPGYAASVGAAYNDADWTVGTSYREVQRGFQLDVGFPARSEYRFVTARVLRRVRLDDVTWLRALRPHVTYREYFDLHGFTTTRLVHIDNHFAFANGAFFQLPAFNYTRESSTLNVRFNDTFNISLRGTWYDVRLAEGGFRTTALRFRASYAREALPAVPAAAQCAAPRLAPRLSAVRTRVGW